MTEYSAAFGPRPPACSPAIITRARSSNLASIWETVTLETPVRSDSCARVSGPSVSSSSSAARSFSSRSRLGVPGFCRNGMIFPPWFPQVTTGHGPDDVC